VIDHLAFCLSGIEFVEDFYSSLPPDLSDSNQQIPAAVIKDTIEMKLILATMKLVIPSQPVR
jgi:hypothetical protein